MHLFSEGNPAQQVVLESAQAKIFTKEPMTEVERIVLREYVVYCKAKLHALELKSQKGILSDTEYEYMATVKREIDQYGGTDK